MKRLLIGAVLGMWLSLTFAVLAGPPMSVVVQTNSTRVLPSRQVKFYVAVAYASNTVYAQGAYVKVADGQKYMALTAGNSSPTNGVGAPPTHRSGAVGDWTNGLSWYAVYPTARNGWVIHNAGTNELWGSMGPEPAQVNKGFILGVGSDMRSTGLSPYELGLECSFVGASTQVLTFQEW
jgi:hypothetical protein